MIAIPCWGGSATPMVVAMSDFSGGNYTFSGSHTISATTSDSVAVTLNIDSPSSLSISAYCSGSSGYSTTTVICPELTITSAQIIEGLLYFTGSKLLIQGWTHQSGAIWQIQAANNGMSQSNVAEILIALDALLPSGSEGCSGCVVSLGGSNSGPGGGTAVTTAIANLVTRGITLTLSP